MTGPKDPMHARLQPSDHGHVSTRPDDAGRRTRSLRARLLLLVLSLLVPALAASAFLVWDSSRQANRLQERQLVATARALSLVVDRQLSEQTGLLQALSASYRLESGEWDAFDAQARRALGPSRSWVAVRAMNGQQLVNTLRPRGETLPRVTIPRVPPNFLPRADGVRVSKYAMGAVAREPVIVVVKEVAVASGGHVDLSIVTRAGTFSELLRRQRLPASWTATILDGDQRVIARSRQEDRFQGKLASGVITEYLKPGASGVIWSRSLDGVAVRSAFEPVANSDWTVVVGVPKSELQGPARRALAVGAIIAIALMAAGVVLALRAAGLITRGVKELQAAAAAGVGDGFVRPGTSRVAEIDELGGAFEEAASRVTAHNARQQLLINELNHRVKNTLATLQSVATHSRRSAGTVEDFHAALEGRIMAMSGAHELLTRASWSSADLETLAHAVLKPFAGPRLTVSGPAVQVAPTDTLNLTLIFYELATNAAKYGALSGADGAVELSWERHGDDVRIHWVESGGPAVQPQSRHGFGSRLIHKAREALRPSEFHFHPEGVRCSLTLRARAADSADWTAEV